MRKNVQICAVDVYDVITLQMRGASLATRPYLTFRTTDSHLQYGILSFKKDKVGSSYRPLPCISFVIS